jgi:hypothetical protein
VQLPVIYGVIDRRILVNYRVDPEVLARTVPKPFRPQVVGRYAIAGICLIRMKHIRPRWLPEYFGIGSENAAHRVAVEWDEQGITRHGVYIPRRDSSSFWNALAGGRLFPGVHHYSRFSVNETVDRFSIEVSNADGTHVAVEARIACELPPGSVFQSLPQASEFFHCGSIGYSATRRSGVFEGLELRTSNWDMVPLAVSRADSSFFADQSIFPAGSIEFDCAVLMRNIAHEWHDLGTKTAAMPAARC